METEHVRPRFAPTRRQVMARETAVACSVFGMPLPIPIAGETHRERRVSQARRLPEQGQREQAQRRRGVQPTGNEKQSQSRATEIRIARRRTLDVSLLNRRLRGIQQDSRRISARYNANRRLGSRQTNARRSGRDRTGKRPGQRPGPRPPDQSRRDSRALNGLLGRNQGSRSAPVLPVANAVSAKLPNAVNVEKTRSVNEFFNEQQGNLWSGEISTERLNPQDDSPGSGASFDSFDVPGPDFSCRGIVFSDVSSQAM